MSKPNQFDLTFRLDRRELLTTAAIISIARGTPTEAAETAIPAEASIAQAKLPVAHAILNVCAATARRIDEIVARNQIRQEAQLPLLSIPKELRRMKTADDLAEFEEFAAHYRQAVWEELLAPVRAAKGDPHWSPTGMIAGLGYQARMSKILRERFQAARAFPNRIEQPRPKPLYLNGQRLQVEQAQHTGRAHSRVASGGGFCTPAQIGQVTPRGCKGSAPVT
jgi:hypothetical protein